MYAQTAPNLFSINLNYDSLFSLGGFNLQISDLNKMENNQITEDIKKYLKEKTWPAIKTGTRELAGELSPTIKKLFLAAAGLTIVLAGGQIVREALTTSSDYSKAKNRDKNGHKKRTHLSRRIVLCVIGTGLLVAGIGTILFSDSIAEFFTTTDVVAPHSSVAGLHSYLHH